MNKSERCLAILDILQKQHKVEVNELAKRFGISEMTVRRDLNLLARQYNITRTHGGALMANPHFQQGSKGKDSGKSCHAD